VLVVCSLQRLFKGMYCNSYHTVLYVTELPLHSLRMFIYFNIQDGTQNDPIFDLVLIIQPCNERCFVT
jgi:hypothetical protein